MERDIKATDEACIVSMGVPLSYLWVDIKEISLQDKLMQFVLLKGQRNVDMHKIMSDTVL